MTKPQGVEINANDVLDELASQNADLSKELAISRARNKWLESQIQMLKAQVGESPLGGEK